MSLAVDPLFEAPETKAAIGVQRYRADYVARDLWRLYHGRVRWALLVRQATSDMPGTAVKGGGSLSSLRAAYLDVVVPAHARLGLVDHRLRVWRSGLRQARGSLKQDELLALEDWMERAAFSSVFRVVGPHVRRSEAASEDLARAVLKLMAGVEVLRDDRG